MLLVRENSGECSLIYSNLNNIVVFNTEQESQTNIQLPDAPIQEAAASKNKLQRPKVKPTQCNIVTLQFSMDKRYIALSTEDKQLVVYDHQYRLVKNVILNRIANKICFSPSSDIVVADRTGDVYLYTLQGNDEPVLLLGHLSVILDILVTPCGKYVITCDRDEKIRVSNFPNAYNIATFCLGHTEFVIALQLIKSNNVLVSGSGDGTVRFWNYLEGKQVGIIHTRSLSDDQALQKFAEKMSAEKVEVAVLPINTIQVLERNSDIILAISLYSVSKLFLYSIEASTIKHSLITVLEVKGNLFSYSLCNNLYMLTDKLVVYELDGVKTRIIKTFENKFPAINEPVDILALYKRKFDNVQEYLDRKKMRLETK